MPPRATPTPTVPQSLDNIEAELLVRNNAAAINGDYKVATQAVSALSCLRTLRASIDKLDRLENDRNAA